MRSSGRRCWAWIGWIAVFLTGGSVLATDGPEEEAYEFAFMVKVLGFTAWQAEPAERTGPVHFGVFEDEGVLRRLMAFLTDPKVRDRIMPVLVTADASDAELAEVRLLYFPREGSSRMLERVRDRPILTFGHGSRFLADGGILRFDLEKGRLAFDLDPGRAERNGIQLNIRVVKLARKVEGAADRSQGSSDRPILAEQGQPAYAIRTKRHPILSGGGAETEVGG